MSVVHFGPIVVMVGLIGAAASIVAGQDARPVRDPRTPGYVTATDATELADGAVPPVTAYGNFVLGPTHAAAAEASLQPGAPQGTVHTFTMNSVESKTYPGIARAEGTRPTVDPADPAKRIVVSGPAPYTRRVAVYVPQVPVRVYAKCRALRSRRQATDAGAGFGVGVEGSCGASVALTSYWSP